MHYKQYLIFVLTIKKSYSIIKTGSQSAGWFPSPKGGGYAVNTYEELSLVLGVAMLIVTILIYMNNKNGIKK